MNFPSSEFDDAVSAMCHGTADPAQGRALTELLAANASARDEYLFCVELHARLASAPSLFMAGGFAEQLNVIVLPSEKRRLKYAVAVVALAACLVFLAVFIANRPQDTNPHVAAGNPMRAVTNSVPASEESTDALTLHLRLESLRARLAASEDRLRRLEMAGGEPETGVP